MTKQTENFLPFIRKMVEIAGWKTSDKMIAMKELSVHLKEKVSEETLSDLLDAELIRG